MNFHAAAKSLLKQTDPNAIYRVSAKRISRMIHHPESAPGVEMNFHAATAEAD
jgi:hypothetical protein